MGIFYYGLSMQSCEGAQNAASYLQQSYREHNNDNSFALSHLFALATIYLQDGDLKASEHYARLLLDKARKIKQCSWKDTLWPYLASSITSGTNWIWPKNGTKSSTK
jgi:hypothetical protein